MAKTQSNQTQNDEWDAAADRAAKGGPKGPQVPAEQFKKLAAHLRQDAPPTDQDRQVAEEVVTFCEGKCEGRTHDGPLMSRAGLAAEMERRAANDGHGYQDWPHIHASLRNIFPKKEEKQTA